MLEKLKSAVKWVSDSLGVIMGIVVALLYFLLRRSNQQVAELQSQAKVTEAEAKLEVQTNEMDHAAADYATKRAEYDKLRSQLPRDSE